MERPLTISEILHLSFIEKSNQLEKDILTQIVRVVSRLPDQKFVTPEDEPLLVVIHHPIHTVPLEVKVIDISINNILEVNLSEIDFDNAENHYHIDNILSINLKSFTTLNNNLKANETFSNNEDFSLRDLYVDDLLKIFNEVGYSLKTLIGEPI